MIKQYIKKLILLAIQKIEAYEYRNFQLDQSDASKKILKSLKLNNTHVMTDTGWQPVSAVHITQPYDMWIIRTISGKSIQCADDHIVYVKDLREIFIKDIHLGELIMTEDGYEEVIEITKEKSTVSMFDLTVESKDHRYYTNGILSHNTVTSSIFIAWYVTFHSDRNVLVVANKLATTNEIVDKIRTILKNLPYFMKPGLLSAGVTGMRFDNGNRLFSQATTKTAAIGFTIHLLYADEFAHIHSNFLLPFYRSIYPTLSSSQISRIIISSTPNGMNLFYEIYQGALEGKNNYKPIRVDWWQVPGRDEQWRKREVANLGSEELFNQEYGNQFLASSRLLFDAQTLMLMKRVAKEYVWVELEQFLDYPDISNHMKWHPDFDPSQIFDETDKIVISIDLGDGVGRDYSVINVFKLEANSPAMVRKTRTWSDESSFFRLKQVGMFRSNAHSVEEVSKVAEILCFEVFRYEAVKIVLEMNFKGHVVYERLSKNRDFFPEMFLHTKHSLANDQLKLGVKLQKDNRESFFREMRNLAKDRKIVITEVRSFEELSAFGVNAAGRYESQIAHDDVALSIVNTVSYFNSIDFFEMVEDIYDTIPIHQKKAIERRMELGDKNQDDSMEIFRVFKEYTDPFQATQALINQAYDKKKR